MNFKNILTIAALTGFSASVAIGQGTAPTIVQGDYVSNVFGQSNFVKNPNAKLNTKNVSVSGATVTRSVTTPLVATSEYNVAVTSANGTVSWATRSFDAGMKNQNCEARFSYRGFQATSKAQIKQGANVVAELTLTPSATDPRIASINFPCGDLSAATTFVITDSATLSGTNEIGGIYVGLATNQANVAQAELVGTATFRGGTSCGWAISGTQIAWSSFAASGGSCDWTSTGVVQPQSKLLKFDHVLKPGKYRAILNGTVARTAGNNDSKFVLTDGTNFSGTVGPYYNSTAALQAPFTAILNFEVTSTQSKLIEFKVAQGSTVTSSVIAYNNEYYLQYTIYRFPSSSELVVTPETQNVWGASTYAGTTYGPQYFSGTVAPTSYTTISDSGFTSRRTLKGKCKAPISGDDVGCQIENMPVGNYKLSFSGLTYEINGGIGYNVACGYEMFETTLAQSIASRTSNTAKTASYASDYRSTTMTGVFTNNSVANRNFVIRTRKGYDGDPGSGGRCSLFVGSNSGFDHTTIEFVIEPLDNASNSALYVQGPVKAAATGAAIPAGYVGEEVTTASDISTTATVTANVPVLVTNASITLSPGVWDITYNIQLDAYRSPSSTIALFCRTRLLENGSALANTEQFAGLVNNATSAVNTYSTAKMTKRVYITSGTNTYQLQLEANQNSANGICYVENGDITASFSGDDTYSFLRAVRIN